MHAPSTTAAALTRDVLDAVRWYATGHPTVMDAALTLAERVGAHTGDPALRAVLLGQIDLLSEAYTQAGPQDHDRARFTRRADQVRTALSSG